MKIENLGDLLILESWDNRAVPYFDEVALEKNPNTIYPIEEIKNK